MRSRAAAADRRSPTSRGTTCSPSSLRPRAAPRPPGRSRRGSFPSDPAASPDPPTWTYVVPEAAPEPRDDEFEEEPPFVDTLRAGAVTIPTNQSISAELDALLDHNARADATRERRGLAAGLGGGDVEALAADIYEDYRAVVADIIAGWIMRLVADGAAGYRATPRTPCSETLPACAMPSPTT